MQVCKSFVNYFYNKDEISSENRKKYSKHDFNLYNCDTGTLYYRTNKK